MEKILDFIAKETDGKNYKSYKYCFESVDIPKLDYEDKKGIQVKKKGETDRSLITTKSVKTLADRRYGKGTSFTKLKIHRLHFLSSNLKQKIKLPCLGKTQRKWNKKLNLFVNGEQENTPLQNYAEALE